MAFEPQQLIKLNDVILLIVDELENACDNVGKTFEDPDFDELSIELQLSATGIQNGKLHVPRYEKHSGYKNALFNQYLWQYSILPSESIILKTEVQTALQTAFTAASLDISKEVLTDVNQLYFISQIVAEFIQKHIKIHSATYFGKKAVIYSRTESSQYILNHFLTGKLFPISFNFLDGQDVEKQKEQLTNYFQSLISNVILKCDVKVAKYRAYISADFLDDDPAVDPWEDSDNPPDDGDKDKPEGWQPGDPIPDDPA